MGLIWGTLGLIAAILVTVCARIVADDAKEWSPWVVRRLIDRAVRRLPEGERARREEEWLSHINELPGVLAKLYTACGYLIASRAIGKVIRRGEDTRERLYRVVDVLLAVPMIGFLSPAMIFMALLIKLESSGPVLIRQEVIRKDGYAFQQLRFRCVEIEKSHRSRVGRFLKLTNIAELPMLFNIVRGDMRFVDYGRYYIKYRSLKVYFRALARAIKVWLEVIRRR